MVTFEKYTHYGNEAWVRTELKGKHREHCLCWACEKFVPGGGDRNCPTARVLYELCRLCGLVTPVWECPNFEPKPHLTD